MSLHVGVNMAAACTYAQSTCCAWSAQASLALVSRRCVLAAADRRRQDLLRQVQAIRREFDQLHSQVAKWPEVAQPAAAAWEVDPQLRQLADEKAAAVEEQVSCRKQRAHLSLHHSVITAGKLESQLGS